MKNLFIILSATLFLFSSTPAMGQGFFKKALKKVEQGLDKLNEELQTTTQGQQPRQTTESKQPAAVKAQDVPQVNAAGFPTDLALGNLKGYVLKVVETYDFAKFVNTWEYSDHLANSSGMLLRMKCEDNYGGEFSYSGTVTFHHDMYGQVIERRIDLKNYLDYGGVTYTAPEERKYSYLLHYNNTDPRLLSREELIGQQTIIEYTYDNKWNLVRTEEKKWNTNDSPIVTIYIYDTDGRLSEKHMDMYSEYPREKFAYDNRGRITMHENPADIREFSYNERGDIAQKKTRDKMGDEEQWTETYSYTYDRLGNWIKRISRDQNGEVTETVNRVITYGQKR